MIIITSYIFLAIQPDFRTAIPSLLGAAAVIIIMLTVTLYAGEKGLICWSPMHILLIAAIVRLFFLSRSPELSDDMYRYLWDGLQITSGNNPYSAAPADFLQSATESSKMTKLVNHPQLITIYPPAAQLIFAIGAMMYKGPIGLKAVMILIDLGACMVILQILSGLKMPTWKAALYAWHPLPVIETASSGHIDTAGIFFFFIMLLLLGKQISISTSSPSEIPSETTSPKRGFFVILAGISFAFSILTKFIPLMFLPGLLIPLKNRFRILFLAGLIAGITSLTLPFLPDIKNMFITLSIYARNWEFSGFAFRTLRLITSSGNTSRLILACLFFLIAAFLYTKLWSKKRNTTLNLTPTTFYHISLAFLFLTPTLHPWYALYLVCFFPFIAGSFGLILSWTVFLSYYVLIDYYLLGQWVENNYIPMIIWGAPLTAFLLIILLKKMFHSEAPHVR